MSELSASTTRDEFPVLGLTSHLLRAGQSLTEAAKGHWTRSHRSSPVGQWGSQGPLDLPICASRSLKQAVKLGAWELDPRDDLYLFTIAQNRITVAREWTTQSKHCLLFFSFLYFGPTWLKHLCFCIKVSFFLF